MLGGYYLATGRFWPWGLVLWVVAPFDLFSAWYTRRGAQRIEQMRREQQFAERLRRRIANGQ